MDQEVVRRRNTVFLVIYRKVTLHYPGYVPKAVRRLLEAVFLILALGTLCLWSYVHFTYIVEPEDCLVDITERPFPYEDILQVEVYTNTSELWGKRQALLKELYASLSDLDSELALHRENEEEELHVHVGERGKVGKEAEGWFSWVFSEPTYVEQEEKEAVGEGGGNSIQGYSDSDDVAVELVNNVEYNIPLSVEQHSLYELFDIYTLKQYSVDYTILEFSQEPGYLSLTQSARTRLNITTRKLYINPESTICFGGPFGHFITKYFLGYDMMVIASFKNLLPLIQGSGYVKNLLTGSHYYYRVQWMGKWRYIAGLLPSLFFTLVASVLLRQIHYHVFKFLTHFHHLLNEGVPMPIQTGAQIPFLIITYAAIGLVIVMSEALGDDSLFSLLMVATVWEADQFYAVFCRHHVSKLFFPMFFYLYHFVPYAYFIRFNGQFWFIPFLFHWFLIQHSVLFFFHHYELNARRAQPIMLRVDVHDLAGQQPGIHIHLPQQRQPQPQPQQRPEQQQPEQQQPEQQQPEQQQPERHHQQQPPLQPYAQVQPFLAEVRNRGHVDMELQQRRGLGLAVSETTHSPLMREQSSSSDSQTSTDTPDGARPGAPVEESSPENGRSALYVSPLNIVPSLHRKSSESRPATSLQSGESSRLELDSARPDIHGLRERRLLHLNRMET